MCVPIIFTLYIFKYILRECYLPNFFNFNFFFWRCAVIRFQKARASDHVTLQREAFLQKVHHAVMLFHEVHAQLSEGATFYSDLSKRLSQLNQTCEDLVSFVTPMRARLPKRRTSRNQSAPLVKKLPYQLPR